MHRVDSFEHAWSIRTSKLMYLGGRIKKSHFLEKVIVQLGSRDIWENTWPVKEKKNFKRDYYPCLQTSIKWTGHSGSGVLGISTLEWGPRLGKCCPQPWLVIYYPTELASSRRSGSMSARGAMALRFGLLARSSLAGASTHTPSSRTAANGCYSPLIVEFQMSATLVVSSWPARIPSIFDYTAS